MTGVILLNLGGPERLEDVEPFLFNLFSDRQIIRLGPRFLQKPLARFIAWRRGGKSRAAYRQIGGGSPLARITEEQGEALQRELNKTGSFQVCVAMRYWRPYAQEALAKLEERSISKIVALPLYPHYSMATTGSSIKDLRAASELFSTPFEIVEVSSYPSQPSYIEALTKSITSGLQAFSEHKAQVLYSAHSLPVKFIEEGDPYCKHLNETIKAIEDKAGIKGRIGYQSRSGPVEWLSPSTPEVLEQLATEGCRQVLIVPISFVSDHVETLYEIDVLYKKMAEKLGMQMKRSQSLNLQPEFIKALKELVQEAVG